MRLKVPHTFVLLFSFIAIAAVLTWIVPAGEFSRESKKVGSSTRSVIVADSYHEVDANEQTWQVFSAFFDGFVHKADIIIFILIVGGAFMIINRSNAITLGIQSILNFVLSLNKRGMLGSMGAEPIIIAIVMFVFSLFGAVFGMSEETIPFVLILVPLAISMGYDSIVGVSMCFVAAGLGFAGAILNPFTIGVAQGIAEIPVFSGLEYRFICFLIIDLVGITYVLRYAAKIKRDPKLSPVYEDDAKWRNTSTEGAALSAAKADANTLGVFGFVLVSLVLFSVSQSSATITMGQTPYAAPYIPILTGIFAISAALALKNGKQFFVLALLFNSILFIIVGVMAYGWYIKEIATVFFALGVLSGIAMAMSGDDLVAGFMDGVKDIAGAAIVVAIAAGIVEILEQGRIIDTILHSISGGIAGLPAALSVNAMYVIQTGLNVFIPSGSGQAALTMPIMAPLADLIGISRQSAVLAFQFGDGFTNLITPTSGVLIGCLGMAKIPFEKWFKWMIKMQIWLFITAVLLLIPTVLFQLNGF